MAKNYDRLEQGMIAEKSNVSKQCVECVKFTEGNCKGKANNSKPVTRWGTKTSERKTGLNFCKEYEYDETLYVYPDKMPTFHTIKKEAKVKYECKKKQNAEKKHADLVNIAQNLKLEDFEHLL